MIKGRHYVQVTPNEGTSSPSEIEPSRPTVDGPSRLQSLPYDIHYEIWGILDFRSALFLKITNHWFYDNLNLDRLPTTTKRDFLVRAEHFPQNWDRLVCFCCDRLLSKDSFGNTQRKGPHGKNSPNLIGARYDRYCWDCGAEHRLYPHSHAIPVRKGNEYFYYCSKCRQFHIEQERCWNPDSPDDYDWTKRGWMCWDEDEGKNKSPSSPLQRLPHGIQKCIFDTLSYRDSIMLAATSKHFQSNVDPQQCPLHDKYRFTTEMAKKNPAIVLRPASARRPALEIPKYACYGCFRVLLVQKFSEEQVEMSREWPHLSWKRLCQRCVYRIYVGRESIEALQEWKVREMCKKCKLLKVWREQCLGCREKNEEKARATAQRIKAAIRKAKQDSSSDTSLQNGVQATGVETAGQSKIDDAIDFARPTTIWDNSENQEVDLPTQENSGHIPLRYSHVRVLSIDQFLPRDAVTPDDEEVSRLELLWKLRDRLYQWTIFLRNSRAREVIN
ncbi:uncharacterized protein BCR38DRAFT_413692 [Pseudomassariella vexata]|uniref:F-box domain-containing protein n=1 Tax=Pseudomassariella vexata TaxID=1141098 RepID=A0A1Y2DET9_9PEZI|nr:uncharacterized protein BCR38DRAFT_413692 [Pseudomassariella vexata]ORY57778.1 hypothetical protein BCR38DRAFT_413692 [Pseudomassariella vexata]